MTLIAALILVPGLLGIVYYLRRIALALEMSGDISDEIDSPAAPTVQPRGFGGAGPMRK